MGSGLVMVTSLLLSDVCVMSWMGLCNEKVGHIAIKQEPTMLFKSIRILEFIIGDITAFKRLSAPFCSVMAILELTTLQCTSVLCTSAHNTSSE